MLSLAEAGKGVAKAISKAKINSLNDCGLKAGFSGLFFCSKFTEAKLTDLFIMSNIEH